MNAAAAQPSTVVVVVPQIRYQLIDASVQAIETDGVAISCSSATASQSAYRHCRLGTLNGVAAIAANAQLVNAACVVAYGAGSLG